MIDGLLFQSWLSWVSALPLLANIFERTDGLMSRTFFVLLRIPSNLLTRLRLRLSME